MRATSTRSPAWPNRAKYDTGYRRRMVEPTPPRSHNTSSRIDSASERQRLADVPAQHRRLQDAPRQSQRIRPQRVQRPTRIRNACRRRVFVSTTTSAGKTALRPHEPGPPQSQSRSRPLTGVASRSSPPAGKSGSATRPGQGACWRPHQSRPTRQCLVAEGITRFRPSGGRLTIVRCPGWRRMRVGKRRSPAAVEWRLAPLH